MENKKIKIFNKFASLFFGLLILACAIFPNLSIWAVDEPDYTGFELQMYGFSSEIDNGDTATDTIHFDVNNTSWSGVYKLQINYSNQLTPQEYAPGEIQIKINDPTRFLFDANGEKCNYAFNDFKISADPKDSTEKQYTFSYEYIYPTYSSETKAFEGGYILFTNNNTIDAQTSFTGSIQISFPIDSKDVINNLGYDIYATMGTLKTNSINISFNVAKQIYSMNVRNETKISGYSGLPENAEEYIWVKTRFYRSYTGTRPVNAILGQLRIPINDENIVVVTNNTNYPATKIDNAYYVCMDEYVVSGYTTFDPYIFIGYPKNTYTDQIIEQKFELYGTYYDMNISGWANMNNILNIDYSTPEKLCELTRTYNLTNFAFDSNGNNYGINIRKSNITSALQNITYNRLTTQGAYGILNPEIEINTRYQNNPYNIRFGIDLLVISDDNGNRIIPESNYYFKTISLSGLKNENEQPLANNKYICNLYIKKHGENYQLYDTFLYNGSHYFPLSTSNVVGYYFEIENLEETIGFNSEPDINSSSIHLNNFENISTSGNIHTFTFLDVYNCDSNTNEIILNTVDENAYANFTTKELIKEYDLVNYEGYKQRDYYTSTYKNDYMPTNIYINSNYAETINNIDKFISKNQLSQISMSGHENGSATWFTGYDWYTLLPKGVILNSTEKELEVSFLEYLNSNIYTKKYYNELKESTTIEIIKNWKNQNQTMIHILIDCRENPLMIGDIPATNRDSSFFTFAIQYNLNIPYNTISEYGEVFTSNSWGYYLNTSQYPVIFTHGGSYSSFGRDTEDINANNDLSEEVIRRTNTFSITTAVESYQDVQTQVMTDITGITADKAVVPMNGNYSYKLVTRTGLNAITNLKLYNNLEMAYGENEYWQGEFLSIDTSYAEGKGYTVKAYYSENASAGNLYDDEGNINSDWLEYNETAVDTTKVKALVFEYLDSEGNSAIIPKDTFLYVLVNMKAPNEILRTYAYNNCRTEWTALDDLGDEITGIVGIESNTVKTLLETYFDITVDKIWNDNEDALGLRPDSIDVILYKNDYEVDRKSITTDISTVIFEHLPYEDFESYTIGEERISTYSPSIIYNEETGHYEITNTITDDVLIDINGVKTWENDTSEQRPEFITVYLFQDGVKYKTLTTTATENWEYTFIDVYKYKKDGSEYVYHIEEEPIENYITTYPENTFDIINFRNLKTISGTKTWENDTEANRPDSITIKLFQDDVEYKTTTSTANDNWTYTFGEVPIYKEDGSEYVYRIEEEPVENYIITYGSSTSGLKIKFSSQSQTEGPSWDYVDIFYKLDGKFYKQGRYGGSTLANLSVEIPSKDFYLYWRTDGSQCSYYGFSIDSIEPIYVEKPENITPTTETAWQSYTIEELLGDNYPTSAFDSSHPHGNYGDNVNKIWHYTSNSNMPFANAFNITNFRNLKTISGTKTWKNDTEANRPDSITIKLFQDDVEYKTTTSTANDNWTYSFGEVPIYKEDGSEYVYRIEEEAIENYITTYPDNTFNITNFRNLKAISDTKIWENDTEANRPESITIKLFQDNVEYKTTTATANDNWTYTFGEVPIYKEDGSEYVYRIEETPVENYISFYSTDESYNGLDIKFSEFCHLQEGHYVQIYYKYPQNSSYYNVRRYSYLELAGKTINIPNREFYLYWHADSNERNSYGFSIDSIIPAKAKDFSYWGSGFNLPTYEITESSGINYPDGAFENYTDENIEINKLWHYTYDSIYSQPHALKLTNIYNVTEISGRKTWIDDSDEVRPESITIKLLQDGIEYKTTTITADDNWTYSFNDIPLCNTANGNKYTYTIEEETLEDYFTEYKTTVNGVIINFNPNTYMGSGDSLCVYYNLDGSSQYYYKSYHYSDIANSGYSIKIPANNFYMYWHTDSYTDTSYGFSIDSIVREEVNLPTDTYKTLLPPYEKEELSGNNYPDSNYDKNNPYHNYGENVDKVWHYTFSDSEISFNQNIINYYKYTEISGQKTWIDDTEEIRPEEITIKLIQNGIEYATTTTTADDNWTYSFNNIPTYNGSINNKYTYSIQEEPIENYLTEYKTTTNGVSIIFDSNTYTSYNDFVSIYYEYNGKLYKTGDYCYGIWNFGTDGVVTIPSDNFYLHWKTDGDTDNNYGFTISSIIPTNVDTSSIPGYVVNSLPLNNAEELIGNNYPDSNYDGNHPHGAYGNNINKIWHYTLENAQESKVSYNVINKYMLMDFQGTKTWKNDSAEERPESITIKLLQDGVEYTTTTTTAAENWEYEFEDIPRYREDRTYYNYSIEEVPINGYYAEYSKYADGLKIKFNNNTHKGYNDQLYVFYEYEGEMCCKEVYAYGYGTTIEVPSNNFYLYWKTDGTDNNYYGFSIDSITQAKVYVSNNWFWNISTAAAEEVSGSNYPTSAFDENHPHGNYGDNVFKLWHYTADFNNNTYYNTQNTKNLYTIEIQKQDFFSKEALPNVVFDLYEHTCSRRHYSDHDCELPDDNDCWTHVGNYTTDETGLLTLNDIYISNVHSETSFGLVETAPDGYYIPEGTYWEINIKSYDNGEISIKTAGDSANRVAFLKPFMWTGYNMSINKVDGRYILENVKPLREVEVTKRIKASDINYHNGIPTFLFKLTGIDDSNTERTYYKQMQFTEEYVSANTDVDGYVSITETFENLISTTYTLSEETVGRYEVGSITDIEGGTATTSTVEFDLVNNLSGKATFTNEKYEDGLFSHNDFVINVIDNSNTIESFIVTAETPVIEAWEDQGIYKVSNAYIEYDILIKSHFSIKIKGTDFFMTYPITPNETMEEIATGAYYVGDGLIVITEPVVVEDMNLTPGIYCEMNPSDSNDFPAAYIMMIGDKVKSTTEFVKEFKLTNNLPVLETIGNYYKISHEALTFEEMMNAYIFMQEGPMYQQIPIAMEGIEIISENAYNLYYFLNVIEDTIIDGVEYSAGIYSRNNPEDMGAEASLGLLIPANIITEHKYEIRLDSTTEILEELEDGICKISNDYLTYEELLNAHIRYGSNRSIAYYPCSAIIYKISDCVYSAGDGMFIFVTEDTTIEGIDLTAGTYSMNPSYLDDDEYYMIYILADSSTE